MNYTQPMTYDFPYENPVTKIACGVAIVYLGFMAIKHAKGVDQQPIQRKHHKGFTRNNIDEQIDSRNRSLGGKVPSNPSVPFYSNQNYNRRRRSKNFW